jgi:hypothetical protein
MDKEALKKELEEVAEFIKKFPESLHVKVFKLLTQHLDTETDPAPAPKRKAATRRAENGAKPPKVSKSKTAKQKKLTVDGNLELGHESEAGSFAAFVKEKKPDSNVDFNTVAIYYLSETKKLKNIGRDHVYTCYDAAGRRMPKSVLAFDQSLRDTANRGYIDLDKWDDIKLQLNGKNLVKHDLPPKSGAGKG